MIRPTRLLDALFLATAFSITFEKVHWNVAGMVTLADVLTIAFLGAFAAGAVKGERRIPRTSAIVLAFLGALLIVYGFGFYNLDTKQALDQFGKGLVKFLLHFLFLAAGLTYLAERTERFYWRALAAFSLGMAVNGAYGILQLVAARADVNLDEVVLSPLTGGASAINLYGAVEGTPIYRVNALTGDPNHLGVMLVVPLLVLTPLYLRLERAHRLKVPVGVLLAGLLLVQLATLSRSGLLGLAVGGLVLAIPYRRLLVSRGVVVPLAAAALVVAGLVAARYEYFARVIGTRLQTGGGSESAHLGIYGFIPDVLASNPLLGLGLNNFAVYYEFVTGKTNWGPHSFYVALLVETGLIGTALFAAFLVWLFRRLRETRAIGRELALRGDPLARRVRPLAWGLTAALAGTMAANLFYLTMTFYYFYSFAILIAAAPAVFAPRAPRT